MSAAKDIESNAPAASSQRSARSFVCLSLAAAAALLVFFVAGSSTGAAIVIVSSRVRETASQAEAREAIEIQSIMMGLNSTALKDVEIEWEALKASHPGLVEPSGLEEDGQTSGNGTHGRRAASIYDTATPGYNPFSVHIPRDHWYTLLVRSKIDVLDTWCPILRQLEAANNRYAIWWTEVNLGIIPGHYNNFCLFVPHVKLMYTVKYKYGMYNHVGNVVPGGTEGSKVEFKWGVSHATGSSTTETQGFSIGVELGAELGKGISAGMSASYSHEWSYTEFSRQVMTRDMAETTTRELTYVHGYPCVDQDGNDLSTLQAQPHYQFQYIIRYADGREEAINTQHTMHMCFTCGDSRRYSNPQSPYKDDDPKTCPPRRLAPHTFKTMQGYDTTLCYKTEAQFPSVACAGKGLNWQTWRTHEENHAAMSPL